MKIIGRVTVECLNWKLINFHIKLIHFYDPDTLRLMTLFILYYNFALSNVGFLFLVFLLAFIN